MSGSTVSTQAAGRAAGFASASRMFSTRLLRKAYRPGKRQGCLTEVYQCEAEFMQLVHTAEECQPVDRAMWHRLCNEFSDKWEHVCHWVHPSRLADSLTECLGFVWCGEYPARPPKKEKAKVKSNVTAQRFLCPECNVICNSYAQYVIHAEGSRHKECIDLKVRTEAMKGNAYESRGAVGLDADNENSVPQQAYYRRKTDKPAATAKPYQNDPYSWSAGSSQGGSLAAKAKLIAVASMLALAGLDGSGQQNMGGGYDFYEPATNGGGLFWGHTARANAPVVGPARPYNPDAADDDEEEEDEAAGHGGRSLELAGKAAKPFMTRSMTSPAYARYDTVADDESETRSYAESTTDSSRFTPSEAGVDVLNKTVSSIMIHLLGDTKGLHLKDVDSTTLAAAIVMVCESCDVASLSKMVRTLGGEEKDALASSISARLAGGLKQMALTDDMSEVEASFAEEMTNREGATYSAVAALGVHMFIDGAVHVEEVNSMLDLYINNVADKSLSASSLEHITVAMNRLAAKFASGEVSSAGFAADSLVQKASRQVVRRLAALVGSVAEAVGHE